MSPLPEPLPDPIVPSVDDPNADDPDRPEHNYDAWIGRYVYVAGRPDPLAWIVDVFYDIGTQRPEWLALGDTRTLVPLAQSQIAGPYNDLYLGFPVSRITSAPDMPAAGELTLEQERTLYTHYGFDWDNPVPDPLPARWDDGWDTNWDPSPQQRGGEPTSRLVPFVPAITPPDQTTPS